MARKSSGKILAIFLIVIFAISSLSAVFSMFRGGALQRADLLIVYDSATKKTAQELAKFFENAYNLTVRLLPASDLRVKFRAYPVVLLGPGFDRRKLLVSGLAAFIVRGPRGAPMLPYELTAQLAAQLAAHASLNTTPYHFLVNATLYIVEGESPVARINKTLFPRLMPAIVSLASSVFAARVGYSVAVLTPEEAAKQGIPVDTLSVLPAFVAKSSANLTQGTMSVVPLGNGFYTLKPQVQLRIDDLLSQAGLITGYERALQPPNVTGLIRYGSTAAPVKAVIYWDYLCPFSAMFAKSTLPQLVKEADKGLVTLYFADLIIHPQAFKLHRYAHCVYQKYGAKKFIEYSLDAFNAVILGYAQNMTRLASFEEKLARKYNVTNCNANINADDAERLGVRGTPTVVIWGKKYKRLIFIVGVRPADVYIETFKWLAGASKRG